MTCGPETVILRWESWFGCKGLRKRRASAQNWTASGWGQILERLGEVYRVQLPPRGRKVALCPDKLAPYKSMASPKRQEGGTQG